MDLCEASGTDFLSDSVLVRAFITVKRHHDHSNSYKRKHLVEVLRTVSEVWSIITMAGSMVVCRQTRLYLDQKITGGRVDPGQSLEHT